MIPAPGISRRPSGVSVEARHREGGLDTGAEGSMVAPPLAGQEERG